MVPKKELRTVLPHLGNMAHIIKTKLANTIQKFFKH